MEVDTGAFRALTEQVAEQAGLIAELRKQVMAVQAIQALDGAETAAIEIAFRMGRHSVLGPPATAARRRPRHLRAVPGGES